MKGLKTEQLLDVIICMTFGSNINLAYVQLGLNSLGQG